MVDTLTVKKSLLANKGRIHDLGVKRLGLYGSLVRGQMNETSDIDVIVEFETGKKNYDNFIDLIFLLETMFDRKIDMVTSDSMTASFKSHISDEVHYIEV